MSSVNAFNQTTGYSYDPNQGNIFQSTTDVNNQSTSSSYSYDQQGNRTVQVTAPDDQGAHYTTQTGTYASCPGNNGLPCYAVESLSHLYSTVHTTTFYDSEGRAVETITPGPAPTPPQQGNPVYYTVVFTSYNDAQHSVFQSNPFVIAITNPPAHLSYLDPNGVTDYTGQAPGGTATYYDALGRPIAVQAPLLGSPQEPGIACSSLLQYSGVNFTACTNYSYGQLPPGINGDLRVQSLATTWLGGSGNPTGNTIFSQNLTYDPASNLTSLYSNQAPIPGNNNSGGTETQVFCYDEQNRLTWSGNSGTPPCPGNGNPGTPTGAIAAYSTTFVSTHLGQLWQGPLNGGSTQYQYLYCTGSAPHQLTGLYALGSTCSNSSGQGYTSSYDAWGNVTSRTYSNTTAALSYDHLNRFVEWNAGSSNREWYAYDATGNRVLKRSTNSSGTTYTVYPFGLQDHLYSASGSTQSNTYYYFLGGQLLGDLTANGTSFLLTDALGSVPSQINWAAGGASVQANQLFGPYGNVRYHPGTFNTAKGFTGQYNDQLTGLDYFHARSYDPVVGVFPADPVQGNMAGMNPYGYVGGNPETYADPIGRCTCRNREDGAKPRMIPPPPCFCLSHKVLYKQRFMKVLFMQPAGV